MCDCYAVAVCLSRFITFVIYLYVYIRKAKTKGLSYLKDDGNCKCALCCGCDQAKWKRHRKKNYTASRQNDILVLLVHIHDRSFSYLKDALDKLDIKYTRPIKHLGKKSKERRKKTHTHMKQHITEIRNIVIYLLIDFDVYWHTNGKSGPWQWFFADI